MVVTVVVVVGIVIMVVDMPVIDGMAVLLVGHPLPFKYGYSSERLLDLRYCEYVATSSTVQAVKAPPTGNARARKTAAPGHPADLTTEQVGAAVMSFALLADPTRVRMLWALRDSKLDVSTLAAIAECRPTVASQHLSKLRFAGLVEGERQGQRVVYRLRGGHVRELLTQALFHADHQTSGAPVHD